MVEYEHQNELPFFSFDLVARTVIDNQIAIILHVFKEKACILTKTIIIVSLKEVNYTMKKCKEGLERRGFSHLLHDSCPEAYYRKEAA